MSHNKNDNDSSNSHPSCEHHHLAAAHHVAAAYHHLQAIDQHDKSSPAEAGTHADAAQNESGKAHACSMKATEHSPKAPA